MEHNRYPRPGKYKNKEFKEAYEHPAILHYTGAKPFRDKTAIFHSLWWDYANKTGFFYDICNYFNCTFH